MCLPAVGHLNDRRAGRVVQSVLAFSSPALLLEHITRHWRENFVTEDISTRTVLEPFLKRPSVLLVSVDAPILDRYRRFSG